MIKRGDIYHADLNPIVGSEQGAWRPVMVIQNDKGNRHSQTVIIAPITSNLNKTPLPTHVFIVKSCGLEKDPVLLAEQMRVIDCSRLGEFIGHAGKRVMARVDKAVAVAVGIGEGSFSKPEESK
jgi:mRNA interferase MazF